MIVVVSFTECLERCNSLAGCVGFAQVRNDCMMCRNDTTSNQTVPREMRRRYLLLVDHLPSLAKHKGKGCFVLILSFNHILINHDLPRMQVKKKYKLIWSERHSLKFGAWNMRLIFYIFIQSMMGIFRTIKIIYMCDKNAIDVIKVSANQTVWISTHVNSL